MALLSAHLRFATDRFWFRSRLPSKVACTLAIVAAAVYLAPRAWRQAAEFVWLERAREAPGFSTRQVDCLKHAFAFDPRNPHTAYAIGEALLRQSQEGAEHYAGREGTDYRQLAAESMKWFQTGMKLNPWDGRNYALYGWCLDWLDRPEESAACFRKAEELDPNNYYILNYIGLHYVTLGNYAAARPWFERSQKLQWVGNDIAVSYLGIIQTRLLETATNRLELQLYRQRK